MLSRLPDLNRDPIDLKAKKGMIFWVEPRYSLLAIHTLTQPSFTFLLKSADPPAADPSSKGNIDSGAIDDLLALSVRRLEWPQIARFRRPHRAPKVIKQ